MRLLAQWHLARRSVEWQWGLKLKLRLRRLLLRRLLLRRGRRERAVRERVRVAAGLLVRMGMRVLEEQRVGEQRFGVLRRRAAARRRIRLQAQRTSGVFPSAVAVVRPL